MHRTNYQKRIRLTFVDNYFDEKWEEKVIFLCIIHCNNKGVGEGGAAGACAPALSKVGGGTSGFEPPPPLLER